jgi:cytochrome c oxidase assembly protein subunit 15
MLRIDGHTVFRYGTVVAFLLCYVTVLLGGNVMASDSGLACPEWPTCHGTFLPSLSGPSGIEYGHRLAAGVLGLAIFLLAALAFGYERSRPILQRMAYWASGLVLAQALLGGVVVDSKLAIDIVLLHFFLATVLFGLLLILAALANLRDVPKRWADWAWRATDGIPEPPPDPSAGFGAPAPAAPGVIPGSSR